MHKIRMLLAKSLILAATIAAGLAMAPAAQAAPTRLQTVQATTHITSGVSEAPMSTQSSSQCTNFAHVCLWVDKDYNTSYGAWAGSVSKLSPTWWNKVSSFWNRLPGAIVFYTGDGYTGSTFCVDPGGYWDDLSRAETAGWNDNIQSFRYFPGQYCA